MPKNVAAEVAHSLRQRIDSGEWSDTRRLPNERELAAEYSVARNTLRSAIDKVAADGTVLRQVGRGTFLRRDAKDDFLNIIQKLSGVSPIDMVAVRRIIEPRAAALAATNASAGQLRRSQRSIPRRPRPPKWRSLNAVTLNSIRRSSPRRATIFSTICTKCCA